MAKSADVLAQLLKRAADGLGAPLNPEAAPSLISAGRAPGSMDLGSPDVKAGWTPGLGDKPVTAPEAPAPKPGLMDRAEEMGGQAADKLKQWGTQGYEAAKPVVQQGLDTAQKYMAGSMDNPTKWMGEHPIGTAVGGAAAGVTAAMLLGHLMGGHKKKPRPVVKMAASILGGLGAGAKAVGNGVESVLPVAAMGSAVGRAAKAHAGGAAALGTGAGVTALGMANMHASKAPSAAPAPVAAQPGAPVTPPADKPAEPGMVDKGISWAKENPGTAALGIGGGIAASALLAHVLSGPSNDDEDDSDDEE